MPRVDRSEKRRRTREAGAAGKLVGDFSAIDAAGYVRRLIREEGARLVKQSGGLTPVQRSTIIQRVAKLVDDLGRITGETLVVDERRFLKSPAGQRVVDAVVEALEPWPDAMLAVAARLEQLE